MGSDLNEGLLVSHSEYAIEDKFRPGLTSHQSASFREGFKPVPILGTLSLRLVGVFGAFAGAFLSAYNFLPTLMTHPWDLLDTVLLFIFSLAAVMIETTSFRLFACGCCLNLRFKVEYWAKFLSRAWGKFVVYELIASFLLTGGGVIWMIAGFYNALIGLAYFFYSIYGSRKLKKVRREALQIYKDNFETLFDEADVNGDGYLDQNEIDQLADKLGLNLSPNELQVMVNFLDTDRDGKICVSEFKVWFEQNKLPTLV